jgi:hypothetical protein
MKYFFLLLTFIFKTISAGEIDGKGIICDIYGDTIGYFFEDSRTFEYKIAGGTEGLELSKKDIGKYYTNENAIYFGQVKIDRKKLTYQKYSSFRGKCNAFDDIEDFKDSFDIDALTEGNKI